MPELIDRIENALEKIRPYLEADGGDVKVLKVDKNKNVVLELLGNCGSCPMSTMTLKAGVEEAIKREVPEIKGVHAVNITSPDDPNAKLPHSA
ncbi:MAG: NifU family protein [Cyclobacteriaceae bacterium]